MSPFYYGQCGFGLQNTVNFPQFFISMIVSYIQGGGFDACPFLKCHAASCGAEVLKAKFECLARDEGGTPISGQYGYVPPKAPLFWPWLLLQTLLFRLFKNIRFFVI